MVNKRLDKIEQARLRLMERVKTAWLDGHRGRPVFDAVVEGGEVKALTCRFPDGYEVKEAV